MAEEQPSSGVDASVGENCRQKTATEEEGRMVFEIRKVTERGVGEEA